MVIYPDGSVQRLETSTGVSSLKRKRADTTPMTAGGVGGGASADPLRIVSAVANVAHVVAPHTIVSSLSTLSESGDKHVQNTNSFSNSNNNNNGNNGNVTRNDNGVDEDDDASDDDNEMFKRLKVQMSKPLVPVIDLT